MSEAAWFEPSPAGWTRTRLKRVSRQVGQKSASVADATSESGIGYVSPSELGLDRPVNNTSLHIHPEAAKQFDVVPADSLLVCTIASVGKSAHFTIPVITNPQVRGLVPNPRTDIRFLTFLVEAMSGEIDRLKTVSVVPFMNGSTLGDIEVCLPSLSHQRTIAAFLDRRTSAIDRLIAKKERLIELLQEKRQALITQAVTKGLDPSVSMKDSGVEWLGRVPRTWEARPLKHLLTHLVDCPHSTPGYDDDGEYCVVRTADVEPGRLLHAQMRRCSASTYRERVARLVPKAGDILYSREGERFGMAALVPDDVALCLGQRMMHLRAGGEVLPEFLMWSLNAKPATEFVKIDTVGATSPRVNIPTIAEIPIAFPPLEEQKRIAAWLEGSIRRLDATVEMANTSLERLREYRQALISAAVTGKIEIHAEEAA